MIYVGLFILSSMVTIVFMVAGMHYAALDAKRKGCDEPGGSSIIPVIPMIPATLTAAAWALNLFKVNIGFWICYLLCFIVFAVSVGLIIVLQYKMRKLEKL